MIKAVVMLLEKAGRYIFVKRSPERKSLPNKWSLPSGKIEEGEDFLQTSKREAMEELGVTLNNVKIIEEIEIKKDGEEKIIYFIKSKYENTPNLIDQKEFSEIRELTLEDFFNTFPDSEIGHGLQYLRVKLGFS